MELSVDELTRNENEICQILKLLQKFKKILNLITTVPFHAKPTDAFIQYKSFNTRTFHQLLFL